MRELKFMLIKGNNGHIFGSFHALCFGSTYEVTEGTQLPHMVCTVKCQSAGFITIRQYLYIHCAFSTLQAIFSESTLHRMYSGFQFINTNSETLRECKLFVN